MKRLLILLVAGSCLAGCKPETGGSAAAAPQPAATNAPAPTSPAIEPVSPHGAAASSTVVTANGATLSTPHFAFDLPAGWRSEQPSSSMRLVQAVLPGEAGPGELVLFYFGAGQGGTVEGNFDRWRGQVVGSGEGERGVVEGGPFRTSWLDLRGTLLPSGMGAGPTTPQPGFRFIGAVVEGENGPWFFKLTGPEATIAKERDAFFGLLKSFRRPA